MLLVRLVLEFLPSFLINLQKYGEARACLRVDVIISSFHPIG